MDYKKTIADNKFYQISKELLDAGATYASLLLLNEENEVFYKRVTNENWDKIYLANQAYKKCHIMEAALNTFTRNNHLFVFVWDMHLPKNEESIELDLLRKENKVCHGVAFCNFKNEKVKEVITVASSEKDLHFSLNVLKKKHLIHLSTTNLLTTQEIKNYFIS